MTPPLPLCTTPAAHAGDSVSPVRSRSSSTSNAHATAWRTPAGDGEHRGVASYDKGSWRPARSRACPAEPQSPPWLRSSGRKFFGVQQRGAGRQLSTLALRGRPPPGLLLRSSAPVVWLEL